MLRIYKSDKIRLQSIIIIIKNVRPVDKTLRNSMNLDNMVIEKKVIKESAKQKYTASWEHFHPHVLLSLL